MDQMIKLWVKYNEWRTEDLRERIAQYANEQANRKVIQSRVSNVLGSAWGQGVLSQAISPAVPKAEEPTLANFMNWCASLSPREVRELSTKDE